MTNLFDIKGKVALITGSTHGLGMAMAKGLGQAGATIVVNGNSSQEKIDHAVNELKSKIDWRQDFEALAIVSTDSKNSYDSLIHWISFKNNSLSKVLIALSIILPCLFFGFLIAYIFTSKTICFHMKHFSLLR